MDEANYSQGPMVADVNPHITPREDVDGLGEHVTLVAVEWGGRWRHSRLGNGEGNDGAHG